MGKQQIQIRPMNINEYEAFQEYTGNLNKDASMKNEDGNIMPGKIGNNISRYVFQKIYPEIDITQITPATMAEVVQRTLNATSTVEEGDIKNFIPSGIGELPDGQNTVKPVKKQEK